MGGSNADRTSPLSVSPVRRSTSPLISEQPHLSRRWVFLVFASSSASSPRRKKKMLSIALFVNFTLSLRFAFALWFSEFLQKQNIVLALFYKQSQSESFFLLCHLAHPQLLASAASCQALKWRWQVKMEAKKTHTPGGRMNTTGPWPAWCWKDPPRTHSRG